MNTKQKNYPDEPMNEPVNQQILKVNGHVATEKTGIIFCEGGQTFTIPRQTWDEVMSALLKNKKIQVTKNLTLIY